MLISSNFFKKIISFVLILMLPLSIIGCSKTTTLSVEEKEIETIEALKGKIVGNITLSGILVSEKSALVSSETSGTVESVQVIKGQKVHKGEPLIILDSSIKRAKYNQALANFKKSEEAIDLNKINYETTEKEFKRKEALYKINAISQQEYDKELLRYKNAKIAYESSKTTGLDVANANLELAKLDLEKATINSPITGVIVDITVEEGEMVSPGRQIISIAKTDSLVFRSQVEESYINKVQLKQKCKGEFVALPNKSFDGEVKFISPVALSSGQQYPVEIKFPNPSGNLKAGMTGNVELKISSNEDSIYVPKTAIIARNGQNYMDVMEDKKVVKRQVNLGIENEKYVVVLKGLEEGECIRMIP